MKKILIAVLFLMGIFNAQLFASDEANVSWEARQAFKREFPTAKFATWNELKEEGIYTVRFLYNGQGIISYVSEDGEILAIARRVEKENLPLQVGNLIETKFNKAKIKSIEEITIDSEVSYLVTMENDDTRKLVRVYLNGNNYIVKKEKLR